LLCSRQAGDALGERPGLGVRWRSSPLESLSIAFGKAKWTFTDANGTVTRGWNIITNTPIP